MAQLQIYKKWVIQHERKHILGVYKQFMDAYESIFDTFKEVEEMAETVRDNTSDNVDGSNCYKISNAIKTFNAYKFKAVVLKKAK